MARVYPPQEFDQRLVDRPGLVILDPVAGVSQSLDAVVGNPVAWRVGQLASEVLVAFAPDDEHRAIDDGQVAGTFGSVAREGAIVVDGAGQRARLGDGGDVPPHVIG